jgi:NTP pyrophosphatase (non-canonical NTP hydrolase)
MDELLEEINDIPEPTREETALAEELVNMTRKYNHEPDELLVGRLSYLIALNKRGHLEPENLTLHRYQYLTRGTAIYPRMGKNYVYPTLGLLGEAGEVAENIKKAQRDDGGVLTEVRKDALKKELGDVLWYVAALAAEFHFNLGDVAMENLRKLNSRKKRGKIKGSGDNR